MGKSAGATLFYGYVFDEENTYPWLDPDDYDKNETFDDRDWEESHHYVHRALGKTEEEIDAMKYTLIDDLFEQCPVKIGAWGYLYEGQDCYLIHPKDDAAVITAGWDTPASVDLTSLTSNPEWDVVLKTFAEQMGIDLKGQEPGWHLVASYG